MKNIFYFLPVLSGLSLPFSLSCQDNSYVPPDMDKRKMTITSASVNYTSLFLIDRYSTLDDFKSRYGNRSLLLNADFSSYSKSYWIVSPQTRFAIQLGAFPLRGADTKEDFKKEIRAEISYTSGDIRSLSFFKTVHIPGDTLVSSNSVIYTDTTVSSYFNFSERTDDISVNTSLVFTTSPNKRFHFSGGAGMELGASLIYSAFTGSFSEHKQLTLKGSSGKSYGQESIGEPKMESEAFNINPFYYARIFFPISVDFRLSKKNEVLKHFYLFLQSASGIDYVSGNGSGNARVVMRYGSGIRYRIFTL